MVTGSSLSSLLLIKASKQMVWFRENMQPGLLNRGKKEKGRKQTNEERKGKSKAACPRQERRQLVNLSAGPACGSGWGYAVPSSPSVPKEAQTKPISCRKLTLPSSPAPFRDILVRCVRWHLGPGEAFVTGLRGGWSHSGADQAVRGREDKQLLGCPWSRRSRDHGKRGR